jgi:hypothetical protein
MPVLDVYVSTNIGGPDIENVLKKYGKITSKHHTSGTQHIYMLNVTTKKTENVMSWKEEVKSSLSNASHNIRCVAEEYELDLL